MNLEVVAGSIEGRKKHGKQENQDAYLVDEDNDIYIVADGMGGAPGGDVASNSAVALLHRNLLELQEYDSSDPLPEEEYTLAMSFAVEQTNAIISAASRARKVGEVARSSRDSDPMRGRLDRFAKGFSDSIYDRMDGMATTLDALVLRGREAHFVHVGDGRVYRFDAGLQQVSEDHIEPSLADAMQESFRTVAQSRSQPTSMVGLGTDLQIQTGRFRLDPGQGFFLCTDGVSKTVSLYELSQYFSGFSQLHERLWATVQDPVIMSSYRAILFGGDRKSIHHELASADDATYIAARRML